MAIEDNVRYVLDKIGEAAIKSGRNPEDVTLVGVTKSTDCAGAKELLKCGITNLAENRVQMLRQKQAEVEGATWHLIGHLQTNKVKDAVGRVSLIQSLDSIRLAEEINRVSENRDLVTDCLVEVNIFKEESKSGIYGESVVEFLGQMEQYHNICIRGFMSMAPVEAEEAEIRRGFEKMFKIYVDNKENVRHNINILSMGMSRDFEYAVSEGANYVRVGRRLFC